MVINFSKNEKYVPKGLITFPNFKFRINFFRILFDLAQVKRDPESTLIHN